MGRIKTLAEKHKRFGYRRVYILLRKAGEIINHKKVFRLWQSMNLSLPKKRPRKKIMKMAASGLKAEFRNHVWTYDFMFDRLNNGRKIKVLMLEDEFTTGRGRSTSSRGAGETLAEREGGKFQFESAGRVF